MCISQLSATSYIMCRNFTSQTGPHECFIQTFKMLTHCWPKIVIVNQAKPFLYRKYLGFSSSLCKKVGKQFKIEKLKLK